MLLHSLVAGLGCRPELRPERLEGADPRPQEVALLSLGLEAVLEVRIAVGLDKRLELRNLVAEPVGPLVRRLRIWRGIAHGLAVLGCVAREHWPRSA